MEELHVAVEELRLQNEELLVSRLQLEQERQRYQELFDFAPDGYIVTNGDAIIQEVNHSAAQLLNIPQKYLPGKPLDIFVYLPDRDLFNRQWLDITTEFTQACETSSGDFDEFDGNDYATGKLIDNWEIRFQPRQGEPFPIAVSLSATCNAEGHLTKLLWLIRDLRSVKRAEATIQRQADFLDMATDAIWVQNLEGKILYWNQGAEKIYGWKTEEAQQQLGYQLLCDPASRQGRTAYKATADQGYWRGELQKITKSGQEILVESHWTLGLDSEGIPQYILIVDNDITEKKQLEQQLFQAQRLDSLGSLAAGIVHDLNNIFSPIMVVSQLLKMQFSNSGQQTLEMLEILEATGKHGVALVQKILQFIQGVEEDRSTMQLSTVIDEIQAIATRTFPKSIELRINIQPDLWLICGDFNQLYQVILNLCINARDAMPDGGILKISAYNLFGNQKFAQRYLAAEVKPYVVVTISDTGIGIPTENLDRIFDPFFTTKDRDVGTGLGLSTVLGLVKSHGGFIEVSSKMGQGTQFQVFLPAVDWVEAIAPEKEEPPTGNGELILVVDD
ncbi:MAG: PAS domain S-box protein, partial [Cyanobacteriota bacterium]|nr:PAS domain S-box protein [Cyanobacteriota bacterium]